MRRSTNRLSSSGNVMRLRNGSRRVSSMSIARARHVQTLTRRIGSQTTVPRRRKHCRPSQSGSKPRTCSTSRMPTAQKTDNSHQAWPPRQCSRQRPPRRTSSRLSRSGMVRPHVTPSTSRIGTRPLYPSRPWRLWVSRRPSYWGVVKAAGLRPVWRC